MNERQVLLVCFQLACCIVGGGGNTGCGTWDYRCEQMWEVACFEDKLLHGWVSWWVSEWVDERIL